MVQNKTHFEVRLAQVIVKSVFICAGAAPGWCDSDDTEYASVNGGKNSFTVPAIAL